MIAGGPFGSEAFAGFLEDTGTPPGLVFSTMRHNRANGTIGISNTRTGSIVSTTALLSQINTGDNRSAAIHRGNSSSKSLRG